MIRTPTSALWVRMLKKRRSLSPARKNLSTYWPLGKESNRTSATNYLITRTFWWSRGGSNPWPPHCERGALPTELLPHEMRIQFRVSSFKVRFDRQFTDAAVGRRPITVTMKLGDGWHC